MKVSTLLILGAAGAGAYLVMRKPPTGSGGGTFNPAPAPTAVKAFSKSRLATSANSNAGKQAAPVVSSPGGRDIAAGLAAAGAGAACAAVPGIGAVASPLCGMGGAYLGAKAYDYGERAVNEIASWF